MTLFFRASIEPGGLIACKRQIRTCSEIFGVLLYYRKVLAEIKLCKLMILPKEGIENRR